MSRRQNQFLKRFVIIFGLNYQCLQRAGVRNLHKRILSFSRLLDGQLQRRRSTSQVRIPISFHQACHLQQNLPTAASPWPSLPRQSSFQKKPDCCFEQQFWRRLQCKPQSWDNQIIQIQTTDLASSIVFSSNFFMLCH